MDVADVTRLIGSVLGTERPALEHSFVEAGGSSLAANRLAALLARECGIRLRAGAILGSESVRQLITMALSASDANAHPVEARPGVGTLSSAQRSVLLAERWARDPQLYVTAVRIDLVEPMPARQVEDAVAFALREHPVLLGRIVGSVLRGNGVLREGVAAPVVVRERLPADGEPGRILPIDIHEGPLAHVSLLVQDAGVHGMVVSAHHVACDGEGMRMLIDDVGCRLRGEKKVHSVPSFAEFLSAKAARPADPLVIRRLQDGLDAGIEGLRALPGTNATTAGHIDRIELEADLTTGMGKIARRLATTSFAISCAAFADALAAVYELKSLVLCVALTEQHDAPTWSRTIGHYINLVPVPVMPPVTNNASSLADFTSSLAARIQHRDVHVSEVVEAMAQRTGQRPSLVRFVITSESGVGDLERRPFARIRWLDTGRAPVPVLLSMVETPQAVCCTLTFRDGELKANDARRLLEVVRARLWYACELA